MKTLRTRIPELLVSFVIHFAPPLDCDAFITFGPALFLDRLRSFIVVGLVGLPSLERVIYALALPLLYETFVIVCD